MKTALFLDEQDLQVVLTPQSEQEKYLLKLMRERLPNMTYEGGFYSCQGGWVRQYNSDSSYESNHSLMIRLPPEEQP